MILNIGILDCWVTWQHYADDHQAALTKEQEQSQKSSEAYELKMKDLQGQYRTYMGSQMAWSKTYSLLDKYEAALAKEREQAKQATLDFQQKEKAMKGKVYLSHYWWIDILHDLFL